MSSWTYFLQIRFTRYLSDFSKFTLSLPPENIRKPYGFLMFAGATERVHWEQMGLLYLYEAEA